jgi:hypothetical protein
MHRPGFVVGGRTGHSPPAFDPGAEFTDKCRVVHDDDFRLSNRRQECRRSQGDGRCGNPGRRSPAGALALGYHVSALQAGGAVWRGDALPWSAGASEARHRFSARGQATARPRRTSRHARRLATLVVVSKQSGVALRLPPHQRSYFPGRSLFPRSRSLHGRVVKGNRGFGTREDLICTVQAPASKSDEGRSAPMSRGPPFGLGLGRKGK